MSQSSVSLKTYFINRLIPHRVGILCIVATAISWGCTQSFMPFMIKKVIDSLGAGLPLKTVIFFAISYILLLCLHSFNFRMNDWLQRQVFPLLRRDIINSFFDYIERHSYRYMQNHFGGSLANKIADISNGLHNIIRISHDIIYLIVAISITLVLMFSVHPFFAGILVTWILSFVSISYFYAQRIDHKSKVFSESKSVLIGHLVDIFTNMLNIWLFTRRDQERNHLATRIDHTVVLEKDMLWTILKLRIIQDTLIVMLVASMLFGLIYLHTKGLVTYGDFTFILMTTVSIFQSVWWVSKQLVLLAEETGKAKQALTILNVPHEIIEAPSAKPLILTDGKIEFKKVLFHHKGGHPLFSDLTLTINPGEKVGLVGFSGSGKTTLTHLLLRFFDINHGQIMIDGQDISKITLDSLRHVISMIPQDTVLFHRSLMDNIRCGRSDATDAEVIEAAKKAEAHDFIMALPHGYDSLVGERGLKLSGGQRQRIAIARAILKDAPILILDEATSALDSVTEKKTQDALDKLMQGRTTLVIAHRLSTLDRMNRILVFDRGTLIEEGTHTDLLSKDGHYAHLWALQAGGFLPENQGD